MKKFRNVVATLLLVTLVICGCVGCSGSSDSSSDSTESSGGSLSVAYVCNGTLGDKSFFDSAAEGMYKMEEELGVEVKIIEAGFDSTNWQPALEDAVDMGYDIIIVGSWEMQEPLEEVSVDNPDQKFIIFDTEMDYSTGDYENVYSISYKYNEEAFLAGALAAMVTESDMELANQDAAVIGFIGGIDSPVINDYLVGYIEGAQYVSDNVTLVYSYVGDFEDSTKGKELAVAQYTNSNADVVFAAAGQAGLGAIDAAKDCDRYVIGVDGDQALIFAETDEEKANKILTSAVSNIGNSLYDAVESELAGELEWGTGVSTGIVDGTGELVDNEYYQELVPEEFRDEITAITEKIVSGEIVISSAIGMDDDTLQALISSIQ